MIGLIVILFLIFSLLFYLALAEIRLVLDSEQNICKLEWQNIALGSLHIIENEPVLRLKVFFWKKDLFLFRLNSKYKQNNQKNIELAKKKKKKKKQTKKFNFLKWSKTVSKILKSFKVEYFECNIDTDDYLLNSYLSAVFFFLSRGNGNLRINYQGEFKFRLKVSNRPFYILKAFIF